MVSSKVPQTVRGQDVRERPWSGRIWRSKLRRPPAPTFGLSRPRILAQIDAEPAPLTLIVAPPGFGKSTAAGAWAIQEPQAAWVTADADDASLLRFWAHLREAFRVRDPGFGDLVEASFRASHRASARDLGRMLADELLDAAAPMRLVLDDFHLVPESETHAFLSGLFEIAPPSFRCVITARTEPPLPLARLRVHGVLREVHGRDLLFTAEETRALLRQANPGSTAQAIERRSVHLWQQTQGWAAGLRLVVLAAGHESVSSQTANAIATTKLLDTLLDEMLANRAPEEQLALIRAAIPEAFLPQLVASLLGPDVADAETVAAQAIQFALAADLCRPSAKFGGSWLDYHPLFQDGLRRRLARDATQQTLTTLHTRAAEWFVADGLKDAAIGHWLAAGQHEVAIALVEQAIQPAFDREDWALVARWLALLPDDVVSGRFPLLLARGWVAHLRGRSTQLLETVRAVEERLTQVELPTAERQAVRAELDLLVQGSTLAVQVNPGQSLTVAQNALVHVPAERRYQHGLAWTLLGMALHATGQSDQAEERLGWWAASQMDRVDAGSMRGLFGLLFVHAQAGRLTQGESVARALLGVATHHRLRLVTAWGHRFLGDIRYERNDLDGAIAHYAAAAGDAEHFNLTGVREVHIGLALAYVAASRPVEAWRSLERAHEILLGAGAIEHVPTLTAAEAFLAWRTGDLPRAERWARTTPYSVDDATLYLAIHPAVMRAAILSSTDDPADLQTAQMLLETARERAANAHFAGPLVRIEALQAIVHLRRGELEAGVEVMRRSLATGWSQGYARTYLDLLPTFAAEMATLAACLDMPGSVHAALMVSRSSSASRSLASHGDILVEHVTDREREVLVGLAQRLSYKEIADQLFISPLTVKRHASSVYSKLGVAGRNDAVIRAHEIGWLQ